MPWVSASKSDYVAMLEKSGEEEVRKALARGDEWVTHDGYKAITEKWLQQKADDHVSAASIRAETREEESIRIAHRAARWSMWAVIIALLAVVVSARELMVDLIGYVLSKI